MADLKVSDETLMAYADGELTPAAAEQLESAFATDPTLAGRVATFLRSRRLARAGLQLEPVSPELRRSVAAMAGLNGAKPRPPKTMGVIGTALILGGVIGVAAAAVLLIAVGLPNDNFPSGDGIARIADARMTPLLDRLPTGGESTMDDATVRAVGTFRLSSGQVCRDFEVTEEDQTSEFVSCRMDGLWKAAVAVSRPDDPNTYQLASGEDPVDMFLANISAGEPLGTAEEQKVLGRP